MAEQRVSHDGPRSRQPADVPNTSRTLVRAWRSSIQLSMSCGACGAPSVLPLDSSSSETPGGAFSASWMTRPRRSCLFLGSDTVQPACAFVPSNRVAGRFPRASPQPGADTAELLDRAESAVGVAGHHAVRRRATGGRRGPGAERRRRGASAVTVDRMLDRWHGPSSRHCCRTRQRLREGQGCRWSAGASTAPGRSRRLRRRVDFAGQCRGRRPGTSRPSSPSVLPISRSVVPVPARQMAHRRCLAILSASPHGAALTRPLSCRRQRSPRVRKRRHSRTRRRRTAVHPGANSRGTAASRMPTSRPFERHKPLDALVGSWLHRWAPDSSQRQHPSATEGSGQPVVPKNRHRRRRRCPGPSADPPCRRRHQCEHRSEQAVAVPHVGY